MVVRVVVRVACGNVLRGISGRGTGTFRGVESLLTNHHTLDTHQQYN